MTANATRRFPLLRVAGSPYAMGRAHGEAARALIARSLVICREMLPAPFEQAVAYCLPSLAHAREVAPELTEEVHGIADGAGFTTEEIFTLNASLDLLLSGQRLSCAVPPDCWAAAVDGEATADGHTIVTWTAEDSAKWFDTSILLEMRPDGSLPCLLWTFAGFVGRPGLNPYLALSATAQVTDNCGDGLPYPFICRLALQQQTAEEALAVIRRNRRMAGMSYTVGDCEGNIATVITSANSCRLLESPSHWTAVTGWQEAERLPQITHCLQQAAPAITLADLQRLQRDHGPGNLCAHNPQLATLCAFLADVQSSDLWVVYGSPCEGEYIRYHLE